MKTSKRPPNTTEDGQLACAYGEPWIGLHPLCDAAVEASCRQFREDVAAGKFDADGYTPAERRAQAARKEQQPMAKRSKSTKTTKATKPRAKPGRKKWTANRVNTLPSNGDQPESREAAPERVNIGEAMRRAVEALGDVTIDEQLAASQLRQLAELYENVTKEQAAYDQRSEEAKTAKKSLESAQNLLLEQVRAFTHAAPLPLFDRVQAEADRADMIGAGDELRPGVEAEH